MARIPGIGRLFRLPMTARRVVRDVDEEIEFHVGMRTDDLRAQGMNAEDARRQALLEFGDVDEGRAELARMARRRARLYRRAEIHEWLWRDLRSSLRSLRHDPRFTIGVMLALALGVGANAVMFGMTDRVLLRPPPHVAEPDRIGRILFEHQVPGMGTAYVSGYSWPDYVHFARESRTLDVAGYAERTAEVGRGQDAEDVRVVAATGNYFTVLGVRPVLGRFFTPAENVPKRAATVAVLGHGYWQERYGGSYAAIGSTIELNRVTYTIIGVAPPRFNGLELARVQLFLPLAAHAETVGNPRWTDGAMSWITLVGRLRDGATREAATAELAMLRARQRDAEGGGGSPGRAVLGGVMQGGRDDSLGGDPLARITLLLLGVSLVVLLVACANVASLMLARALRRTRELAVRVALGVGRGRLLSLAVWEALLLALGGGVLGVLLAAWLGQRLAPVLLPDVDWSGGIVAGRVLVVASLLVVLSTVLIAVLPALYVLRADLNATLRAGVREGGGQRAPVRRLLLVLQAAMTVVLLTGGGLFVRSLHRAGSVDFGFDGERVIAVTWDTRFVEADDAWWLALQRTAAEQVGALPGVSGVALASNVPGWTETNVGGVVTGAGDTVPRIGNGPYVNEVDTAFFRTMGIALLRGRDFRAGDRDAPVVIVDQAFAEAVWPDRDPLGECLFVEPREAGGRCRSVIGLVENAMRQDLASEPTPQFFLPLTDARAAWRGMFVRAAAADAAPLAAAIRERLRTMGGTLPRAHVRTLQSHYEGALRPWRVGVTLFLAFGALALLVSLIGVYSVMSYSVAMRRHELGVRMALGARAGELLGLVVREAARVLAIGLLLGLLLALAFGGRIGSLLFETSPRDPLVFGGVSAVLLVAGLAAALMPARRAARVQAAAMLRAE